jgi:diaminopimelate decarboxylase
MLLARRAGLDGGGVSFCSHALSDQDLNACVQFGAHFVADSPDQIRRYRRLEPEAPIGIRVNVGITAGFHSHVEAGRPSSRFGFPLDQALSQIADSKNIEGLHCHIGSDVASANDHLAAMDVLLHLATQSREIRYLNLGGGYRIPFFSSEEPYEIENLAEGILARLNAFDRDTSRRLEVRLEPGNFLVRDSGFLICTVLEVRQIDGMQILITDANVGSLPGALLYGSAHPVVALGNRSSKCEPSMIVGNLMQPGDVLRSSVRLPAMQAGKLLSFGLCGAYCAVRASTFNGRPLPAEGLLDCERLVRVRSAGSPEALLSAFDP